MRLYFTPAEYLKMSAASDYVVLWLVPSQKIARQVAVGVSHAATCLVALWKVEAASTFSETCNAIFRWETSCKHGVSHEEVFLATCNANAIALQVARKIASCDMAFSCEDSIPENMHNRYHHIYLTSKSYSSLTCTKLQCMCFSNLT